MRDGTRGNGGSCGSCAACAGGLCKIATLPAEKSSENEEYESSDGDGDKDLLRPAKKEKRKGKHR